MLDMSTPSATTWPIEPHTGAKHAILRRYLSAWFPILGSKHDKMVYLDGFCGPGRYEGGEPGSPLIALEEAQKHADRLRNTQVLFWFLDENERRLVHLGAEIAEIKPPGNFIIRLQKGQFDVEFGTFLSRLDERNLQLAPTFAFVDPFGFSGVPFNLMARLLGHQSCELLINFAVDSINRFLEHPDAKTRAHILDLLGISDASAVLDLPGDRVGNLRTIYQHQLSTVARYVRFFTMRDSRDRSIYDLFFASNHRLGHAKMKEAFWKIDPSGAFQFSDATDPSQLVLFEQDPVPALMDMLAAHYAGQRVQVDKIALWVEDQTAYIEKHMRDALKRLEDVGRIAVESTKSDGKKRRKGTFPGETIVKFGN